MITASFFKENNFFKGFKISGHSGYNRSGLDIVCAGVSACTEMTINGISDILKEPCDVNIDQKHSVISMNLVADHETSGSKFIEALYFQLRSLNDCYPLNIKVSIEYL